MHSDLESPVGVSSFSASLRLGFPVVHSHEEGWRRNAQDRERSQPIKVCVRVSQSEYGLGCALMPPRRVGLGEEM
jgi:hypothetical protein